MTWIRIIKFNVIVFLVLMCLIEISIGLVKLSIGRNYLLPDVSWSVKDLDPSHPCLEMKTDVILSHVPNHRGDCIIKGGRAIEDYVVYDNSSDKNPVLLTLGGSTTSGFYQHYADGETWPKYLSKTFSDKFYVVNGGVGSYSAMQEFLKFYKDGSRLKNLSVVISLNGINEQPDYSGRDYERRAFYPFSSMIQYRMNQSQRWIDQRVGSNIINWKIFNLIPNIRSVLLNLRFLDKNTLNQSDIGMNSIFKPISAADRWERNVRGLNNLVKIEGAKYFVFLQPTLGILGPQSKPPHNTNDEKLFLSLTDNYLTEMRRLYSELKLRCMRIDFCIDISDTVPPTGNVYSDPRHHNETGNKILADEIFKKLDERL